MDITAVEIPDEELDFLFTQADEDGGGELDAQGFSSWVVQPVSAGTDHRTAEMKTLVQAASKQAVTRLGWSHLFAKYYTR